MKYIIKTPAICECNILTEVNASSRLEALRLAAKFEGKTTYEITNVIKAKRAECVIKAKKQGGESDPKY